MTSSFLRYESPRYSRHKIQKERRSPQEEGLEGLHKKPKGEGQVVHHRKRMEEDLVVRCKRPREEVQGGPNSLHKRPSAGEDMAKIRCHEIPRSGTSSREVAAERIREPPTGPLPSPCWRSTIAGGSGHTEESSLGGEAACQEEADRLAQEEPKKNDIAREGAQEALHSRQSVQNLMMESA